MTGSIILTFNSVLSMFILLAAGFAARKFRLIGAETGKILSKVIITIAQPALMISSLTSIGYTRERLIEGGYVLLLAAALFTFSGLLSHFSVLGFSDIKKRTIAEYAIVFSNSGFMGIPLLQAVFGDEGAFRGGFYVIIFNIVTWSLGMVILRRANSEIKTSPKNMIFNFGTIPAIIGFVIFVSGITLPEPVNDALVRLGGLCTPLSMIIIGSILAAVPLRRVFCEPGVYFTAAIKLLVLPILCALICAVTGLSRELTLFIVIMAALPTAANTTVFAESFDIMPLYAASTVGISTAMSVITVPFSLYIAELLVK